MKMTGAELIITLLERQGIEVIAGLPGGANLPLYDALSRNPRIRHVLARHEQGAGFMAQGMARVTGRPQVCFATSGPGATNLVTAIADAKLDSIPLVCITGQVPTALIGTDAFQEIDTYGLSIPITKHNYLVRDVRELPRIIPEAFRIASSGRPGPVLIDVPKDVQLAEIELSTLPEPGAPAALQVPDLDRLEAAAALIRSARTPILYVGGGIIASGAAADLLRLAEKASIPIAPTLMALDAIPSIHPLNLGMLGMHGARFTNLALEACDLLIAVGARFDDRATGKVQAFCPNAQIIHIDVDASEIEKIKPAAIGLVADARTALKALLSQVEANARQNWLDEIRRLRSSFPLEIEAEDDATTAYGIIRQAAACLPADAIITTDVGQHQMKVAQAYRFHSTRTWLTSGGLGTMGFGLPAAIGAALAAPERTVVCFSGDGSFLMNMQEMAVLAEENLNVKIILLDNRSLGLVHQIQDLFYGGRFIAVNYPKPVDFAGIANCFGIASTRLGEESQPATALSAALKDHGPHLIHAPVDVYDKVFPMVRPGAANSQMLTRA
ncbi:MAG TPA: acetolactate synthase large subunit [Clostridia bacterium]|nr:acetolactate synthase large subunit [Clostridia bacterium]